MALSANMYKSTKHGEIKGDGRRTGEGLNLTWKQSNLGEVGKLLSKKSDRCPDRTHVRSAIKREKYPPRSNNEVKGVEGEQK